MRARPAQDRRAPERRVGDDSARHAVRSRRHHRPRGAAQEVREAGRGGRRQPDGHGDRGEGRRRGAASEFPQFNASIDMAADEIIYKKYVNIGVAVDTDRGLLVPVIRDADTKNIVQIVGRARAAVREGARPARSSLEEMQGGCFSISNLGGIGGTYFTPIVNAPEVAILGISRARMEPVYQGRRQFVPRLMLPLSLSYDHRVDRRRRRHPLPALGRRSARAAVPAGAAGMNVRRVGRSARRQVRTRLTYLTYRPSWSTRLL